MGTVLGMLTRTTIENPPPLELAPCKSTWMPVGMEALRSWITIIPSSKINQYHPTPPLYSP